jgi:FSR family fosmidomycin resistance protein-like MFS transporter
VTATTTVPPKASETRMIAGISAAHFVSHYYILILPPLFGLVRAEYGVSYTELGLALTAFNVISTLLQVPAGFLVDKVSAKLVLVAGLLLGAVAFAVIGLTNSFWVLVAMFAVAGLGNTVYHPADYALLSHHVAPERIGQAFSFHTFSGILGAAAAPASLLAMATLWGWRGAFLGAAVLGFAVAGALMLLREPPATERAGHGGTTAHGAVPAVGWTLLLSGPILGNFVLFILLALMSFGLQYYSVVALGALHGTDPAVANTALTGYLLLSALGVLIGGIVVARTGHHSLVAALTLLVSGSVAVTIGLIDPGTLLLVLLMALSGLANGIAMPSRDMMVRAVTPPGSFGTVFGFVTTGFNVAGVVAPLIFGALLDHGQPRAVFILVGIGAVLAIVTVALTPKALRIR